jgi:hypothetical protein
MALNSPYILRHGCCEVRSEDVVYIRRFLADFPGLSRSEAILTLSEHLGWTTLAGEPKYDAACSLLEQLDQAKTIHLPPLKCSGPGSGSNKGRRQREPAVLIAPELPPTLHCALAELSPVRLRLVSEPHDVTHVNACLQHFHPLGYAKPFGFYARYLIEAKAGLLGCILLSGATRALLARDQTIGWSPAQRRRNLPWVINNSRFLIFPSVNVPHLASHVLAQLARQLPDDWQRRWTYRPLLLETFVDPAYYRGSCYLGAGWEALGHTSGRGLARPGRSYQSSPKLILIKPLHREWRQRLSSDDLSSGTPAT